MYFDQVHYLLKLKWVFFVCVIVEVFKETEIFFLSKNIVKEFVRK